MRAFDLVFTDALATDNKYLLLIKVCRLASSFLLVPTLRFTQAIILFECGKHDDAISRIDDLIDIVGDQSVYITVRVRQREYLLVNEVNRCRTGSNASPAWKHINQQRGQRTRDRIV